MNHIVGRKWCIFLYEVGSNLEPKFCNSYKYIITLNSIIFHFIILNMVSLQSLQRSIYENLYMIFYILMPKRKKISKIKKLYAK